MKFLYPDKKDISDVCIAIKSFSKAWGAVDPLGNFKESVDPRQLWIMLPVDDKTISILVKDFVPPVFRDKFPENSEFEKAIIHMQAFKVKTGFSSKAWISKVTYLLDGNESPLGYVAGEFQSSLWFAMHRILQFDGYFFDSPESALANCT